MHGADSRPSFETHRCAMPLRTRFTVALSATVIDWPTLDPTAQISAFVKLKFANCADFARRGSTRICLMRPAQFAIKQLRPTLLGGVHSLAVSGGPVGPSGDASSQIPPFWQNKPNFHE